MLPSSGIDVQLKQLLVFRELLDPIWNVRINHTKDLVESFHNTMGPRDGLTFAVEQRQTLYSVDLSYKWVSNLPSGRAGQIYNKATLYSKTSSPAASVCDSFRKKLLNGF